MIREQWEADNECAVVFENPDYDSALIGCTHDGRAVYDYDKMVAHLMVKDGITEEEAIEFIEYNTMRALGYVASPPVIVNVFDEVL